MIDNQYYDGAPALNASMRELANELERAHENQKVNALLFFSSLILIPSALVMFAILSSPVVFVGWTAWASGVGAVPAWMWALASIYGVVTADILYEVFS